MIYFILFISTVFGANWAIYHAGWGCDPVCIVPVGFGLVAPSGVLFAGLALTLRDLIQRSLGVSWAIGAIMIGAILGDNDL